MKYLVIIQARLYSSRFPNKVMQTVKGKTMVRRVWDAAKSAMRFVDDCKIIVAWPERWPDIEEKDLHKKFCLLAEEYKPQYIIRLTADCPLLADWHIRQALVRFHHIGAAYYNNRLDGYDVQIFTPEYMYQHPDKEHVIKDTHNTGGVSVNTPADLEKVRYLAI